MINKNLFPEDFVFAKNIQNAFDSFRGRKIYKNFAYPKDGEQPLDLWYEFPYFGKIDRKADAIFASETNLKQLPAQGDTLFAIDFVVDAYKDFANHMNDANNQQVLSEDSEFTTFEPQRAWESVNLLHHQHMETVYKLFTINYVLREKRENKIKSFEDFLMLFMNFFRNVVRKIPMTRSGFIYSKYCTPMVSGLAIEIKKENHASDQNKRKLFIEDPNFDFYRTTAAKFGFVVDKNAPWRLIADVASPRMQKYMKKYGIQEQPGSASDLFEIYYYQAFPVDIDIMRKYLLYMYNSFVSAHPLVKDEKMKVISTRMPIADDTFDRKYSDLFWIKLYYEMRVIETNLKWDEKKLNMEIKKAMELHNALDFNAAISYINSMARSQIKPSIGENTVCMSIKL